MEVGFAITSGVRFVTNLSVTLFNLSVVSLNPQGCRETCKQISALSQNKPKVTEKCRKQSKNKSPEYWRSSQIHTPTQSLNVNET